MIVFDASTLVSATFRRNSLPARAIRQALQSDRIAVSEATMAELLDVLHRPGLARFLDPELCAELIGQLLVFGIVFVPTLRVADCRDAKHNIYLELALASGAKAIVTSDADLLVLHPWRGVRLLRPIEYVAEAADGA